MSLLRHGPPLALNGFMDKEGRKLRGRKTRYFRLKDSALFNHRRKDSPATWGVSLIDSRVAVGHRGEVIVQLFDGKKIILYPHSRSECDRWVDLLQRASRRKIGNFYGVTGLIGMGSFAEVRIGFDKVSDEQVAIKVMKKNKRDTELMRSVECEMNFISKSIDHENIVGTYDVFDTRDNLFIVMEFMPGGMLYDILANEGYFSEKNAAAVMRDLLEAVKCLHTYDIVHRDIKPENVLAVNKTWPLKVKLADFGLADFVLENSFGEKATCGMYGTPFFVAPEVIRAETYTPAVDIWSLGVLAYNMLSGKLPFDGNNIKEVLRRVRSGKYSFPDSEWAEISDMAKDFIRKLLDIDPRTRLTATQALDHEWITSKNLSERAIANDRSALGHEQRKLRMSSMAIDDVAGFLRLDDSDEDDDSAHRIPPATTKPTPPEDHGVKVLTRLLPAKAYPPQQPRAHSTAGSTTHSRTRPVSQPWAKQSDANAVIVTSGTSHHSPHRIRAQSMREEEARATSEVSIPLGATGRRDEWARSIPFARLGSTQAGLLPPPAPPLPPPPPVLAQTDWGKGLTSIPSQGRLGSTQHDSQPPQSIGGLQANSGFALPAILSVKDIVRRRQAAENGEPVDAVAPVQRKDLDSDDEESTL